MEPTIIYNKDTEKMFSVIKEHEREHQFTQRQKDALFQLRSMNIPLEEIAAHTNQPKNILYQIIYRAKKQEISNAIKTARQKNLSNTQHASSDIEKVHSLSFRFFGRADYRNFDVDQQQHLNRMYYAIEKFRGKSLNTLRADVKQDTINFIVKNKQLFKPGMSPSEMTHNLKKYYYHNTTVPMSKLRTITPDVEQPTRPTTDKRQQKSLRMLQLFKDGVITADELKQWTE